MGKSDPWHKGHREKKKKPPTDTYITQKEQKGMTQWVHKSLDKLFGKTVRPKNPFDTPI